MEQQTNGGFLVSKLKQVQGRVFEKLLAQHGISEFNGAQGRILFVLWRTDDLPITELARQTGLAKATLTGMLDRLEGSGHIRRVSDPHDRRSIRIRLTQKAVEREADYQAVSEEMNRLFYKGFHEKEIAAFEGMLGRILINLQTEEEQHG